nr:RNA-directed DNA polymerase, eukaryota [Tanacetum cinerariifolium]
YWASGLRINMGKSKIMGIYVDNANVASAASKAWVSYYEDSVCVFRPCEDRFVWSLENSGEFSVASMRKWIDNNRFPGGDLSTKWIKSVPIKKVSNWWSVDNIELNSHEEWSNWIGSLRLSSKSKSMLMGVFYSLWWWLWSFRNKTLFDKETPLKAGIFDNVVSSSFHLCKFRCKVSFKWDEWLKNPYLV